MSWWKHVQEKMDMFALIGIVGQTAFAMRFVVQWYASERAKASVIPLSFWYWSIVGGTITLAYGVIRADPVFILAYLFNNIVYVRNLMLIAANRKPPAASPA